MTRTAEQQAALVDYVTAVQRSLGLDHWDIRVEDVEPDVSTDVVLGETMVEHFGYRATMRFRDDAVFGDPDEARRVVAHECAHLFIEHWALDVDEVIRVIVAPPHNVALERAFERSIEAITLALVPHIPLPDWRARGIVTGESTVGGSPDGGTRPSTPEG